MLRRFKYGTEKDIHPVNMNERERTDKRSNVFRCVHKKLFLE